MRTRVALDPDVEQIIRERVASRGVSFTQALNDAVRDGASGRAPRARHVTPVFDMGVPAVNLVTALALAGEMEDEGLIAAVRRGA